MPAVDCCELVEKPALKAASMANGFSSSFTINPYVMAEETTSKPNPNEKLVRVFDTEKEAEALVIKGLLESAGIESNVAALDFPQDVMPMGGTVVMVREEDVNRAQGIIEEYRRSPADIEIEEAESTTDSPPEG